MKRIFKFKVLILLFSIITGVFIANAKPVDAAWKNSFWVEFIDVGQGDCALVQCDGHYMMIDGGPSKASSKVYTILKNKGIKKIDLMIATHPDEDHIGGLSGALNYSSVDTVLSPVTTHDTKTFNSLSKYVVKQGKTFTVPKAGDVYKLGSAEINIIGPVGSSKDTNNQSIVVKLVYGTTSFIFTGDAEEDEEKGIVRKNKGLECDVLKVGHHGSDSSTSKTLLNAVKPKYAVISVGKNNKYGHPTQKTIDKLTSAGATIYRTDLQGDILFTSDGKKLTVETEKEAEKVTPVAEKKVVAEDKADTQKDKAVSAPIATEGAGGYVVNGKNGKIHIVGGCSSPPTAQPIYVNSYEEAEAESIRVAPDQKKRKCGNCYR